MSLKRSGNYPAKFFTLLYENTEGFLMVMLTAMLVIDVLLGILARYVHFEAVFATEMGKYLFIWLCAVGISAAARDNQHVRIHFIVKRLPVDPRITWIITQVIFLIFSVFFLIWGSRLTWMHFSMNKLAMGFNFPMFIFTSALPVGFGLTSIRLARDIWYNLRGSGKSANWDNQLREEISELKDEI
ncbi:MAG: TRAP transporter small permease [Cyclobacteriaceae bacterium]|nr:TRAP transporter small permease [Cyclobacteriaceae bacterium]